MGDDIITKRYNDNYIKYLGQLALLHRLKKHKLITDKECIRYACPI